MKKTHAVLIGICFALGAAVPAVSGGARALMGIGAALAGLGRALRSLSLSGGAGNALAWALLASLGLTPLLGLLPARRARTAADWLWPLAAVYALFMLYMLVNPHLLRNVVYPDWAAPESGLLAVMLLCPLAGLIVTAVFLNAARAEADGALLFRRLGLLLTAAQLLAAEAGGEWMGALPALSGADLAYGILEALGALVGLALLVALCEAGKALLGGLSRGWLNDENGPLADNLARWARRMLAGDLIVMLAGCFLTLAFGARLTNVDMRVSLELGDLVISLCALLLARFVRAGIRVRTENDQFI